MAEDLQMIMGDGQNTYRQRYSHQPDRIDHLHVNAFQNHVQAVHTRLMREIEELEVNKSVKTPEKKNLSAADKKKLFILEKLKNEWDLVSKQNNGPIMVHGVFAYESRAYEKRISAEKLVLWKQECGIDHYDLEDILKGFQDNSLLESFEFINPYR